MMEFLCLSFLVLLDGVNNLELQKREIASCGDGISIVDKHNDLRRKEGAANMKKMKWNAKLALMAERYAAKCLWEHGDLQADDLPYKEVGQNLFASQNEKINFDYVTMKWFEEKTNFNFSAKTCSAGQLCGHYTQIVWSNTSDVGCAHRICANLVMPTGFLTDADYVVCYYGPSGNYREIPVYKKGNSCSACPEDFGICDDGLCSSGPGYGDLDETTCSESNLVFTSEWLLILATIIKISSLFDC